MNVNHRHVVLMGLRGCGKSTLGRAVAEHLHRGFVDLDDLTAAAFDAADAGTVLRTHGELAFRAAEFGCLQSVLNDDETGIVLALGGGTPTAPGAAGLLGEQIASGRVILIYLHASPESLRGRLAATDIAGRPSLTGIGTLDEVAAVYAQRDPLYRSLIEDGTCRAGGSHGTGSGSAVLIEVGGLSVDQAVAAVLEAVAGAGGTPRAGTSKPAER